MSMLVEEEGFIRALWDYVTSLSPSTLDLFAGLTATLILSYTVKIPWILALLPIMLTVRGGLAGVFTGVLTTSLHVGEIKPRFFNNTEEFYSLFSAVFFLSFSNGLIASVIVFIYRYAFYEANFLEIVYITFNTFQFSALISLVMTSLMAFTIYRFGLDPDIYVYPIVSVINDILVGLMIVIVLKILNPWNTTYFQIMGGIFLITFTTINLVNFRRFIRSYRFVKTVREAYIALLFGLIFSTINGAILSSETELLVNFPQVLVIYPAFIAALGSQGVIITSQLTTELRLGTLKPDFNVLWNRYILRRFLAMLTASIFFYMILSTLSILITSTFKPVLLTKIAYILMISGLTTLGIVLFPVSIILAVSMYKKGFDPDNLMISVITTISDFLGVLTLVEISKMVLI